VTSAIFLSKFLKATFAYGIAVTVMLLSPHREAESLQSPVFQGELSIPRFERGNCREILDSPLERSPSATRVECGHLIVPRNYDHPQLGEISLAVVIIHAPDIPSLKDPFLFLAGGPGQPGATWENVTKVMNYHWPSRKRDTIFFSQRGTDESRPYLGCAREMAFLSSWTAVMTVEEANQVYVDALQDCHQRLTAETGLDYLTDFNSRFNAADIESLRVALNYEKLNLYGISYGTLLAQHFMNQYPESIRSVALDGVVPLGKDYDLSVVATFSHSLGEFFAFCRQDMECSTSYPDLEEYLFELADQLETNPARIQVGDEPKVVLDGNLFLSIVLVSLYSREGVQDLPNLIYQIGVGDYIQASRWIETIKRLDLDMALGMYYAVYCTEFTNQSRDPYAVPGVRPELARFRTSQQPVVQAICASWDPNALAYGRQPAVTAQIPTLILNGQLDPVTPPFYGEEVGKSLPLSSVVTFPYGTHGQVSIPVDERDAQKCANDLYRRFIEQPHQSLMAACVDNDEPLPFAINEWTIFLHQAQSQVETAEKDFELWWKEQQGRMSEWFETQKQKMLDRLDEQIQLMWEKFQEWLAEFQKQAVEWIMKQLITGIENLCGSAVIPLVGILGALIIKSRKFSIH
jgi:pimeloyl-ACP methyl ester carboxylesterase